MIVVSMVGGLGNQFFQYAAAKSLATRHKVPIGLDITLFKGNGKESHFRRKFKLNQFNVDFKEMPLKKIREYAWITGNKYIDGYIIKRFGLFEKNVWHDNGSVEDFNSQPNDICLIGCFVDQGYFKGLRKIFQKEFTLKDKQNIRNLLEDIKKSNSISIHIRRGDLLDLKGSYILPEGYYKKAINIILGKIKNPTFYIFSDNIDWCKKHFRNLKNSVFVEGNDVAQDFELMKNCKHNILANSSLSWWLGYLNPNQDSIIIAPKHFSASAVPNKNIQLNDWIVI